MADQPFDPHADQIPQDSFTLAAHEALALVAGSSLAQFFDCIPATVWMTDTDLKLTFAQGPILRDLDVAPEKVLGRTLQEIVLDGREDHPLIHGHLTALSGHATSVRIEWGGILYNARIAPLRDASGTIIGCVGSHQQIGWLPDDDGLLRESDMRLRRIIDSNMIGIAFGNDEGRITEANEAFLQLAGYTREDLGRRRHLVARADAGRIPHTSASGHRRGAGHRPVHAVRSGSASPRRPPRARPRGRSTPLRPAPGRRRLRARHLGPARARPPHGRGAGVRRRAAQRADARSGNRRRARGGLRDARLDPRTDLATLRRPASWRCSPARATRRPTPPSSSARPVSRSPPARRNGRITKRSSPCRCHPTRRSSSRTADRARSVRGSSRRRTRSRRACRIS